MKSNTLTSRRNFLGTLALGAAASSLSAFANPLQASMPKFDKKTLSAAENWFDNIKGTHRIVYDVSTPHDGFPVIWNWAFYLTNNQTGSADDDITAMTVLRHTGIPFAYENRIWEKYKLGEVFGVTDNSTQAPSLRNLYYEPQEGDFPLPPIQGIKDMQARGAMFCVCDLATKVFSSHVAEASGLDATEVYNDWVSGILPDIQLVPSGVWALGRAQQHGCGYIFAGG